MSEKIKEFYLFDEFRLDAENPGLWRNGELVAIPPKALELLILLVKNHGEIVSNDEVMDAVWKDTFVEVGNISYTVSLLRNTLGKKAFIKSVPRRGYRFTATVKKIAENVDEKAELVDKNPLPVKRRWLLALILIGALLFMTSFALVWRLQTGSSPLTKRNIKSIAVLPFKNLSGNADGQTFSLGLADSLITRFGTLNRFTIRPFDTVQKFHESSLDAIQFGGSLKVDAVFEGTFQSENQKVRVTARLIDVRDGTQIWTERFEEVETDIFTLQDKIADKFARSMLAELTSKDVDTLSKRHTDNTDAYRAYLRGRAFIDQRKIAIIDDAETEFHTAVALDPAFALAYAGLADVYAFRGSHGDYLASVDLYKKAKLYAQKALEIDSDSAEAYAVRGRIKRSHDWDWEGAEDDFRRAIEINHNLADAHLHLARLLTIHARFAEARAELEKAIEIDPISKQNQIALIPIFESLGEYDEGLRMIEEMHRRNKNDSVVNRGLATFLYHKREYAKVIEIGESRLAANDQQQFAWYSLAAASYQQAGNLEKSSEMIKSLEQLAIKDTKALFSLAMNYAELGRIDDAFAALERCFETREERIVWLKVEPRFANIRTDPRFQELLNNLRLG